MPASRSTWLWLGGSGLFAAVAVAAVYVAWPILNPEIVASAPLDPQCDLRKGTCTGTLPAGARITLALTPRAIALLEPLRIDVAVEGLRVIDVQVDFAGVDMNMGYNRPTLEAAGADRYAGEVILPACVRNRMEWEAKVLVRTLDGLMAAPFRFWTYRRQAQ